MLKAIWFVPPAVSVLAGQRNLMAAAGLEVQGALTASSEQQFEDLASGRLDVAVTAMDNVIVWNRRGPGWDFRIIGQIEKTTPLSVIAVPEIERLADLRRKVLLVDSPDNGFVVALRALLAQAGVDFEANRIVAAGGVRKRLEALLSREGDATLLGPPFDSMALQAGMRRLASVNEVYPAFPGQGVVARRSVLARNEDLATLLCVLQAACDLHAAEPGSAVRALTASGFSAAVAEAIAASIPRTLEPSREGVALLVDQRRQLGLPGGDVSYDDLVDERLLPRGSGGGASGDALWSVDELIAGVSLAERVQPVTSSDRAPWAGLGA